MNIYENGIRKLITFKNTYATYYENIKKTNQFIFSSPLNNAFFGMSIEKGYAVNKSDKKNIKSGFQKIEGGEEYNVFNSLFGATSETYKKINHILNISKEDLKNKIKKYLDLNGLVTFGVYFNLITGGHAFSIIGYKQKYNGEFFVEILNPWHKGNYLFNNIKKNTEYNKLDESEKEIFNAQKKGENINEEEFMDKQELYKIFNEYEKTGFLTLKIETFYKWLGDICFSDPMLGYSETIVEIAKDENNSEGNNKVCFKIEKETKFRAFILHSKKKIDNQAELNEFFQNEVNLNFVKYSLYLEKYENYDDIIQNDYNHNIIYNNTKEFKNLIYEILKPGNYILEIYPEKIDENLYLKIQANNLVINNFSREDSLDNNIMGLRNCNCYKLNLYPGFIYCNFCVIYNGYQLINKIVENLIKLISYYNNVANKYSDNVQIFCDLLPDYTEYYYCISYTHLYYHYMSTKDGFITLIINKFNFNWECQSRIEYNKNDKEFKGFFSFGNFQITKNLVIYNFGENSEFKCMLNTLGYYESNFNILEVDNFIAKREEKINYEAQIASEKIYEQEKLNQIRSQQFYELKNFEEIKKKQIDELEFIRLSITSEQNKLEQLRSDIKYEQNNLEQIKTSIKYEQKNIAQIKIENNSEQNKLEQLRSDIKYEQNKLEQIKTSIKYEQKNLDNIKSSITNEEKNLKEIKSSIELEQQNLDEISELKISEEERLEEIKSSITNEENNLEEIKLTINSKEKRLEEIKSLIMSEEKRLGEIGLSQKQLKVKDDFRMVRDNPFNPLILDKYCDLREKEDLIIDEHCYLKKKEDLPHIHLPSRYCPTCKKYITDRTGKK